MRALLTRFISYLDSQALWGIRLGQFMKNNLARDFSWYYLFRGHLRFPARSIRGIKHYIALVRENHPGLLTGTISKRKLFDSLEKHPQQNFLIAPGFCMKPYDDDQQNSTCPAGHFNHNCWLIASQEFEQLLWNLEKISQGKRYKQETRYQQINNIYHSSEK